MKILYVPRSVHSQPLAKREYRKIKESLFFFDQEGFFEHSLHTCADVTECRLEEVDTKCKGNEYDWIIVNWKQSGHKDEMERAKAIMDATERRSVRRALLVSAAQAEYMPPETILDAVDVIFKREPFRDRSRYKLSEDNRAKIVPTVISCPFVRAPKNTLPGRLFSLFYPHVRTCEIEEVQYDVGFSGADAVEHTLRQDVWRRVIDEGFSTIGGLQQNPNTKKPIPGPLRGSRLQGSAYRNALCRAKINLALDGIGEYTFRHQEILCVGSFMMSGPSIRELDLRVPLRENEHYVAFDNLDDMVEKIRYYLTHDRERQKIAAAGKELFDEYYDPKRHGKELMTALHAASAQ